jgi:Holliday junction resolvasome RuvABC endonuclease subunit
MSKHKKILAIDPGMKFMGIAFFEGDKLIYHGVKVIANDKSPNARLKEGRKIVLRLINDFRPDILVVERSFFFNNKTASLLHVFINEIRAIGMRKGHRVLSYATSTVRKSICGNGRASKKTQSEVIVSKYPELKVYLSQNRIWKDRYHQNMFDAIALGLMVLSAIK